MSEPSPSPPIINADELFARLGPSRSALTQLGPLLAESAVRWQAEFRAAIQDADAGRLYRTAHQVKGAMLNFAAARAGVLAIEVERLAKNGELAKAQDAISELNEEIGRVQIAVKELASQ